MKTLVKLCGVLVLLLEIKYVTSAPQPIPQRTPSGDYSVTHLDIRDAVLSLVRVLQDQMDKLERHEGRERQLGEQLTRSLASLEKRGRGEEKNIESIAAYIARIDEKLTTVQNTLDKQSDERRVEHEVSVLEFKGLNQVLSSSRAHPGSSTGNANLETKIDLLSEKINALKDSGDRNSAKFDSLMELWKTTSTSVGTSGGGSDLSESLMQELAEIKDALARTAEIETQLLSSKLGTAGQSEWQGELMESMDSQRRQLGLLEEEIGKALGLLGDMTKSASGLQNVLTELENDTTKGFEALGSQVALLQRDDSQSIDEKLTRVQDILRSGQQHLEQKVKNAEDAAGTMFSKMQGGYDHLAKELKGLANVESVLLDTGDSVLDTKRRLEYGVQQIMGEINHQLKEYTTNLNTSLQHRFDGLANAVLGNQSVGITNLTARMEEDIGQVWRQIGILYHEMSRSANLLDSIHSQTSKYVNNSMDTMSSMDGKVGQITNRMGEVDDNLNYLLGRMSLVVQEFNMIKTGLGDALSSLKDSFTELAEHDIEKKANLPENPADNQVE